MRICRENWFHYSRFLISSKWWNSTGLFQVVRHLELRKTHCLRLIGDDCSFLRSRPTCISSRSWPVSILKASVITMGAALNFLRDFYYILEISDNDWIQFDLFLRRIWNCFRIWIVNFSVHDFSSWTIINFVAKHFVSRAYLCSVVLCCQVLIERRLILSLKLSYYVVALSIEHVSDLLQWLNFLHKSVFDLVNLFFNCFHPGIEFDL